MFKMDSRTAVCNIVGVLCFMLYGVTISSQLGTDVLQTNQFEDNDARTRHKRNVSNPAEEPDDVNTTHINDMTSTAKLPPSWLTDLQNDKWYGSEYYLQRYKQNPKKKPTVCYNNVTKDANDTVWDHFVCPMKSQGDDLVYCCGVDGQQKCCNEEDYKKFQAEQNVEIIEFDLVTGLSIAGVGIGCVSACLFLYCCCCQRRPEIHDGIKLIWVRRSFGKEINRLEQPTYPNHLAVVSSSRAGSRVGSRGGSRQGSRNPSIGPSPSVSRRASAEPTIHHHSLKGSHKPSEKKKLGPDVPSSVVITVTTPSDEQGPTEPLLKTSEQKV